MSRLVHATFEVNRRTDRADWISARRRLAADISSIIEQGATFGQRQQQLYLAGERHFSGAYTTGTAPAAIPTCQAAHSATTYRMPRASVIPARPARCRRRTHGKAN